MKLVRASPIPLRRRKGGRNRDGGRLPTCPEPGPARNAPRPSPACPLPIAPPGTDRPRAPATAPPGSPEAYGPAGTARQPRLLAAFKLSNASTLAEGGGRSKGRRGRPPITRRSRAGACRALRKVTTTLEPHTQPALPRSRPNNSAARIAGPSDRRAAERRRDPRALKGRAAGGRRPPWRTGGGGGRGGGGGGASPRPRPLRSMPPTRTRTPTRRGAPVHLYTGTTRWPETQPKTLARGSKRRVGYTRYG